MSQVKYRACAKNIGMDMLDLLMFVALVWFDTMYTVYCCNQSVVFTSESTCYRKGQWTIALQGRENRRCVNSSAVWLRDLHLISFNADWKTEVSFERHISHHFSIVWFAKSDWPSCYCKWLFWRRWVPGHETLLSTEVLKAFLRVTMIRRRHFEQTSDIWEILAGTKITQKIKRLWFIIICPIQLAIWWDS